MKRLSSTKIMHHFYGIAIITVVLAIVIVGLLVRIQALTSQVAELEGRASSATAQLNSFERSLCSTTNAALQVGQLREYNIQSAGYARTYRVHSPSNYDPSVRYPVVISFDGMEGSGSRMESYSGLDALPAIVVYPDSLAGKRGFTSWEGAPYSLDGERDVQFVRAVLQTLPAQYCVDSTQIFAVGMSNGGSFATAVGCELGDQIRAVASVSGAYYTTCRQEERTPSLLILHSVDDRQVPFMGSVARRLPQIPQWAKEQAVQRHCEATAASTATGMATSYNWLNCNDDSTLRLVVLYGQEHGWLKLPQMPRQAVQSSAGYIWKFFQDSVYSS